MADLSSLLGSAGIGGAIGKAIVSLELDTAKYQTELKSAQATTTSSATTMSSGLSKFSSLAIGAFAAAGAAVITFGTYAVKAAIEANEAHLKLLNTFENNAQLADSSVAAFERQADAIRDLTGADDEAIVTAQALLGQFDLTGDQITKLIPLIVDLSAKMGIDLQAAAKAVGKSTQGSSGALSRYGVVIDETDSKADAFTATVEGLGVAEGFAAEQADAEPWRLLGAQWEEIAEKAGSILLPILEKITEELGPPEQDVGQAILELGEDIDYFKPRAEWYQGWLDESAQKADLAAAGVYNLSGGLAVVQPAAVSAGNAFIKLSKAGKDIAEGLAKEIPDIVGTVTTYKETFTLSPAELAKIAASWAKIAKTIAHDLKVIGNADLTPAMREAISALPPEMRHAWVEGNAKQRGAIEKSIKDTLSIERTIPTLAHQALTGGRTVGRSIAEGIALGINTSSELVSVAAADAVHQAINAANRAAGARSPSKEMAKLGGDLMQGLANGISDSEQKAIDAARKALEKVEAEVSKALDKIKGKAQSFGDTIRGAFAGFANIGDPFTSAMQAFESATTAAAQEGFTGQAPIPPDLSAIISTQVGAAQTLADVLEALKRQGAGKALLGEVAESGAAFGQALLAGGPEQIREANQALKTIAELAQQTGKALSEQFFGERIDRVEKQLHGVREDLHELARIEREGHSHDIVVDGAKLGETTRREMIKTGGRNADIFGGRA